MVKKIYSFLFLFLISAQLFPGEDGIRFERLGTENFRLKKGLSQNTVNCILQDSYGFMWFGTWDGLNMYDGYETTIYKPNLYNRQDDISYQTITWISEASDGTLWIATEKGLNSFNRENQKFKRYLHNPADKHSISSDTLNYLLFDSRDRLWIATDHGLNLYDRETGNFKSYLPENSGLPNEVIRWLFEDEYGRIWLATKGGVGILDLEEESFIGFNDLPGMADVDLSSDTINCIYQDSQGKIWIATDGGLDCYDPSGMQFESYRHDQNDPNSLSHPIVNVVLEDGNGRLWIGTNGGGLCRFRRETGGFSHYRYNAERPSSISNDYVISLYEDRSGILWVGTNWKGVNKLASNVARFDHHFYRSDQDNSLNNNLVWSIYEDESRKLWIATDNGVNILDRNTGRYNYIRHDPEDPNTLISDKVSVINKDRQGYMWFGTFDHGCSRYDPRTGEFLNLSTEAPEPYRIPDNDIGDIIIGKEGKVWIGTGKGLVMYDPANAYPELVLSSETEGYKLYSDHITALYEDRQGIFWIGTYHSLERYDRETGRVFHYLHDAEIESSISNDGIFSIFEDSKGRFWIGTLGGGLNLMDRSQGTFTYYVEEDGLPNNVVYAILEDEDGNLWLSTNYGLSMFDPEKEVFVNFDVRDGLQSNEFNLGAAHKNNEGEMFFGGMFGYNSFFPGDIRQNSNIPRIAITSFRVFNEEQRGIYPNGDTVHLDYEDNFFTISFSALDFANPSRNLYRYRLSNFDKDWIFTDAEKRFAEYTRVAPGTYTFQVLGSNSDGLWNEEGTSLTIIISPPWYSSWLFRIPAALVLFGLLWGAIATRFKRLRKKHAMEKQVLAIQNEIIDIRQKALRLQMNPHFIFNSLNSIQSFILANDIDKAIHYLSKFSQLMRTILSNSNEAFVPLKAELTAIRHYMDIEKLRFDQKFDYSISLDEEVDDEFLEIPPMIIQPYIENAIIHGLVNKQDGKGKIRINISLKGDVMHWEIEDDGIGREASKAMRDVYGMPRKSRGMMITKQRLEMLNERESALFGVEIIDLKDDAGKACGTRVVINMPVREG